MVYVRREVTLEDGRTVSRQRKWQLDYPEKHIEINYRYDHSDKGKLRKSKWNEKHKECIKLKQHTCGLEREYGN